VGDGMGVTLAYRLLEPFGVEVLEDLSRPLAPSQSYHLVQLLGEHGLVLARGQALSMERQRELCALFGPILLRAGENGIMSNEGGGPAESALSWHSDAAYTDHPFDVLALHALEVVDDASSTLFVDAREAVGRLSPEQHAALEGREQEMISPHYTMIGERTCDRPDPEALKRGRYPAIRIDPRTGKSCLWVSELQTACLIGMDWAESRDLLHAVFDRLYAPEHVLEHRWRKGDIVIWDNVALQHARGNLGAVGRRVLQRVIVGSEGVAPHIPG